jgi:hypothetical protein
MPLVRNLRLHPRAAARFAALAAALAAISALSGCGMPGAPLPPSLNLPIPVADLSATRSGGQTALSWTMPTKTTDKLLLKGNIAVRICRNETVSAQCAVAATLSLAPGSSAAFTDSLPAPLTAGPPRKLTYFVELVNRKSRSAGLSNGAEILAGQAPAAIDGLTAEMHKNGVLLRWSPGPAESSPVAVRLERRLLSPPAKKSDQGPLPQPAEPLEQALLVEPTPTSDHASIDTSIRFGQSYQYRAQRLARVTIDGSTLELAGPLSPPVQIDAIKLFPPGVPRGLEAVATSGENGSAPAIDLSWLPNSETDLAGYIVYRRDPWTDATWHRISNQPAVGPGFHDSDVKPGLTYTYAVTAVDRDGRESARSTETSDAVPAP